MKELPLLFSTNMVNAILEDRKTQTRRVIKPQPRVVMAQYHDGSILTNRLFRGVGDQTIHPRYHVGDRLWVKETYAVPVGDEKLIIYKATDENVFGVKWKSGRFMFKKYARLWLAVTAVRAERLQEISLADIQAEGITDDRVTGNGLRQLEKFRSLWDSINGKTHPWESEPWVWCYTFKRIETPSEGMMQRNNCKRSVELMPKPAISERGLC